MSKRQSEKITVNLIDEEIITFEKLRLSLITTQHEIPEAGILLMPDFRKTFILYPDACNEGLVVAKMTQTINVERTFIIHRS